MPELPEVETTRRGIAPLVTGRRIARVVVREPRLRWPVPKQLSRTVSGQVIDAVERRAKYLLLALQQGHMIVHLGMSGSLRVIDAAVPAGKHDHVDIVLDDDRCIRLRDPRRFGAVLWHRGPPETHALLRALGPEPLDQAFNGELLYRASRGRRVAVKNFIMDAHTVVGVGNIYASEALFTAGINPSRAAGRVSAARYELLAAAIKTTLEKAIGFGGTTLRDFADSEGRPGYFRHELNVYSRAGEDCPRCGATVRQKRIGQRSSFYCASCQT